MPDDREHRFRQLYHEHYRTVQAYAVRRVATPADVADVTAEVFTTAWRRLDDIPPRAERQRVAVHRQHPRPLQRRP